MVYLYYGGEKIKAFDMPALCAESKHHTVRYLNADKEPLRHLTFFFPSQMHSSAGVLIITSS